MLLMIMRWNHGFLYLVVSREIYKTRFLNSNAIVCRCHLEICNFSTNLEPP
ncbi:hypothetical protein Hdeb2414_s1246g00995391 [Helianthus debilis subsp. tardiflorus]